MWGGLFFILVILQPLHLRLLFCYICVNIIIHRTAVNTTQHIFVRLQVEL